MSLTMLAKLGRLAETAAAYKASKRPFSCVYESMLCKVLLACELLLAQVTFVSLYL